jgi:hypothetical protein
MSQNPDQKHAVNKAAHDLGDVVPVSGRVATAAAGYHPTPVNVTESKLTRGRGTNLRSRVVHARKKG